MFECFTDVRNVRLFLIQSSESVIFFLHAIEKFSGNVIFFMLTQYSEISRQLRFLKYKSDENADGWNTWDYVTLREGFSRYLFLILINIFFNLVDAQFSRYLDNQKRHSNTIFSYCHSNCFPNPQTPKPNPTKLKHQTHKPIKPLNVIEEPNIRIPERCTDHWRTKKKTHKCLAP